MQEKKQKKSTRILSPYEKNQLKKYRISEQQILQTEKPVEYITHHVEFCNLDFYIDESALIPRVETEELVDMVARFAKELFIKNSVKIKIADVGTGSGAISISLSKKLEKMQVPYSIVATEISTKALQIAKKNKELLAPSSEIVFKANNLLDNETQTFDIIVANLPYIPTERIEYLDTSVKDFEPRIALDGGSNGLNLIYQMLEQAEKLITKNGKVFLEVDYSHGYDDFNKFRNSWDILVTPDSMEGVHFVVLTKK